ncbi:Acetyl-CoA acetyltransferase [Fulvivirga imtechensis AK7]|uniref:Acetyl-CoA acetyltransferase n=1 Tax=Fulvivirga imtechensis AK7 TaxID=1237149 RepID=L8JZU0_9BACT|nr:thiolase family protein [Fulvivirga imtechensis]ELR72717.1 Acetyl-CoA acetyltransferase [Fulvivirga imtechensis AK7]
MQKVYIISAKRTAVGGFLGKLAHINAIELGSTTIKAVIADAGIEASTINSVYMGNVISANLGQSPARQAAIGAGIPVNVDATTVNKVCSSGLKAITLGAQQIQLGLEDLVIAGGMESMSNAPFYADIRKGNKYGHAQLTDSLLKDGLSDAYHGYHMGNAAETTVRKYKITREAQDEYTINSYERAQRAIKFGKFEQEIIAVPAYKSGELIAEDEDVSKLVRDKVSKLQPAFEEGGTITAASASNLNDGASAVLLASEKAVEKYGLKPIAGILDYADAAQVSDSFSTSPSVAIQAILKRSRLAIDSIDFLELNEAYASVILANQKILGFDLEKVNVYGGAVALGHPIGASGARIATTLLSVLHQENGTLGLAAICNGGGGATALLVEKI